MERSVDTPQLRLVFDRMLPQSELSPEKFVRL
jgi:hypothetical protein